MATKQPITRTFSTDAQEELICPLCYELFHGLCEPKELDCVHVFCQICLLRIVGVETSITCPECRHITNVPPGGVSSMKCVLRLRNLADKYAKYFKHIPIQRTSTAHLISKTQVATCSIHVGEKMYFLCVTCNVPICQFCLVRSHTPPEHEIKEIKTTREDLQIELENAISDTDEAKSAFENRAKSVADLIAKAEGALDNEFAAIDEQVNKVIDLVREQGEKVKNRLRIMEESRLAKFHEEKEIIDERLQAIKITQAQARRKRASLPDQVYTTRYKPLVKKLQMLCNDIPGDFKGSTQVPKFIPDPSPLQLETLELGRIEMCLKVENVTEFGRFEYAKAIASVPDVDGFAVTDFYGKQVVFAIDNDGSYKEHISLEIGERKYGPTDISVTSEGDILLATWVGIEVFSSVGEHKYSIEKGDFKEGVYSVTSASEGRILVGNIEQSTIAIHEFQSDLSKLVKTLRVNLQPYHIATNDSHVAISQQVTNTIAVVNLDSGEELFRVAVEGVTGICYEHTSNSLLVAKTAGDGLKGNKGSVEQYCADTGRWMGQLVSGLYSPQALALNDKGLLAIADRKSVKVFQIV